MLYLGTADDKTVEYPYGSADTAEFDQRRIVTQHLLFGDEPLLLEEGFILASPEALQPEKAQAFLLPAIRSGLIKIASRRHDMHFCAKERREVNHMSPPDNQAGHDYLAALQAACVGSQAFVDYPASDAIGEVTFTHFLEFQKSADIAALLNLAEYTLPADFYDTFRKTYQTGNNGKRSTARAAWEENLKRRCAGRPDVIHALMCKASRERQILRAAVIGKVNGLEMAVETGFENEPHELATPMDGSNRIPREVDSTDLYPRVCTADAIDQCEKLFHALSNPESVLFGHRRTYLTALRAQNFDAKEIADAAKAYERQIYTVIDRAPCEDSAVVQNVAGIGVGLVVGAAAKVLEKYRFEKPRDVRFSRELMGKKRTGNAWTKSNQRPTRFDLTRREFLRWGVAVTITGKAAGEEPFEGAVMSTIRKVRTLAEDDLGDMGAEHESGRGLSHQILRVNPAAAAVLPSK
jgi:hypothetical protein